MKPRLHVVLIGVALLSGSGCTLLGGEAPPISPGFAGEASVRPGDQVVLEIWNEPEMSDTFNVAGNSELILPKLGALSVQSHTVTSLQDSIRSAYAEYLRNPSVQITVLRRVGVSGAVVSPGIFLVDLTMSLPDVIIRAGGLREEGNPNNIVVLRNGERIRYQTNDPESFVVAELQSGDQVIVGRRNFIQRNPYAAMTTMISLIATVLTVLVPAIRNL